MLNFVETSKIVLKKMEVLLLGTVAELETKIYWPRRPFDLGLEVVLSGIEEA